MGVGVHVRLAAMLVYMSVHDARGMLGCKTLRDPAGHPGKVEHSQYDQHDAHREFHGQPNPGGNGEVEHDDPGANQHDGDRVSQPPQDADDPGMPKALLTADNGRNGDDVIWIRRMPDAQHKTHADDGQKVDHSSTTVSQFKEASPTEKTTPGQDSGATALSHEPRLVYHVGVAEASWRKRQYEHIGCGMALELVRTRLKNYPSISETFDLLPVFFVGVAVVFASLGMGEAVYRLLFSDYDGAKDRLPIEAFFGLVFAWLATSFVRNMFQHRRRTIAKLHLIWDRNHQIRAALEALSPHPHTSRNQQSIRVIREELDRIEGALKEVLPR